MFTSQERLSEEGFIGLTYRKDSLDLRSRASQLRVKGLKKAVARADKAGDTAPARLDRDRHPAARRARESRRRPRGRGMCATVGNRD